MQKAIHFFQNLLADSHESIQIVILHHHPVKDYLVYYDLFKFNCHD